MAKIVLLFIAALVVTGVAAGVYHLYRVSARNAREMAEYSGENVAVNKKFGKVLVVYYSLSGHTRDIAERIHSKTNSDILEIKTVKEIKQGPMLYLKTRKDVKNGTYPELQSEIPDMEKYDVIFVGSPVYHSVAPDKIRFSRLFLFLGKALVLV